jgi:uncharacterized protein (UPF0333 family)
MKRLAVLAALVLLAVALTGCGFTASGPKSSSGTESAPAVTDPYAAIATSGTHEKAALAAIPAALKTVEKSTKDSGKKVTDLSGAKATLFAYTVCAVVDDKVTLFEVRADGKAYGLYGYPAVPDPAKVFWQPAAINEGAYLADPVGGLETAAAAAVAKVVEAAKPGSKPKITMYGYMFAWIGSDGQPLKTAGGQVFTMSIDPKGNAGSWSQ